MSWDFNHKSIDERLDEILQIDDKQEKSEAIRSLMDEFASGALEHVKFTYVALLGDRCVYEFPELGIECYYLSMYLAGQRHRKGIKEAPVHDIDVAVYNALCSSKVNTPAVHKAIDGFEKKYGINLFGARK